jgi:hypothetical protein
MKLNKSFANAETIDRLTQQLVRLSKTFHEECEKSGSSPETEFWRGNFAGTKTTLFSIYGEAVTDDVLNRAVQTTGLLIPHSGPLTLDKAPRNGFMSASQCPSPGAKMVT